MDAECPAAAARAERAASGTGELDDCAYLYLGEGLGCAVVADGYVRRASRGLAGELAHVLTRGAAGRAIPFTEVFAELELRQPGSTAVDATAVRSRLDGSGASSQNVRVALADAIGGIVAALATPPQCFSGAPGERIRPCSRPSPVSSPVAPTGGCPGCPGGGGTGADRSPAAGAA